MRWEVLLAITLLATPALAGCLQGEELSPTAGPQAGSPSEETDGTEASAADGDDLEGAESGQDGAEGDEDDRSSDAPDDGDEDEIDPPPMAVVAHIDTGINPYHEAYRDDSELAYTHPSEYIDGYPENATALNLTLDAPNWQAAFEADQDVWANVSQDQLYWIPGTRIIGAISTGSGGTFCPIVKPAPANLVQDSGRNDTRCNETPILDDHGHGTMTSSRMAGEGSSLCPDCRIVSVEGLGADGVAWLAETGWVDVQTNSWGYLTPDPVFAADQEASGGTAQENITQAAQTHLVYFASGNGFAGFFGFTPWPTHLQPTHLDGVVSVGAHDNGRVAHWQGTPPHVVADGYRGLAASPRNLDGVGPTPFACCTSAASPFAAGLGARLVQEARELLDDTQVGPRDGVLAEGEAPESISQGPLADGELTLDELRQLVKDVAEPRPTASTYDGVAHWMGDPDPEKAANQNDPWGPAGNPYCPGCWTMPISWTAIPSGAPAYPIIGYGGATPVALDLGLDVLSGDAEQPDRSEVDTYFSTQEPARDAIHDPAGVAP